MRTDEQKRADDALTEAIQDAMRAYGMDTGELLVDYIVVTAGTSFDEDGTQITAYSRLYRDSDMPWYRVIGLLETHLNLSRHEMLTNGEDAGA